MSRIVVLTLAVALLAASEATAQQPASDLPTEAKQAEFELVPLTPEQEARARKIGDTMKCPVCRSQSVRQSRSFMAEDMKRKVRELIAEGRSDEEVIDYFVARYGEWILLTPPKSGFNVTAYLLPLLAVLFGAIALAVVLIRAARRDDREKGRRATDQEPKQSSGHMARLERELEETE